MSELRGKSDPVKTLVDAVTEYLSEFDTPAPDYGYRHLCRERMRKAVTALQGAIDLRRSPDV